MDWDSYFMKMAECVSLKSKDTSTKVGAIIVAEDNSVRSVGFNGFPRGVIDSVDDIRVVKGGEDALDAIYQFHGLDNDGHSLITDTCYKKREERPLKYSFVVHAEQNAICQAARSGTHTDGCKMYVSSLPPCSICSRLIIQSGIKEVIYSCKDIPDRWKDDMNISKQMFKESGIILRNINKCLEEW